MEVGKDAAEGRGFYRGGQGRRPERAPRARRGQVGCVRQWGWGDRARAARRARLAGHLLGSAAFGGAPVRQPGVAVGIVSALLTHARV